MTSLANARDIVRGVIASFLGFGGRLLARAILMIFAGHVYGIEALGRLGQVAAITEVSAAICVIGLKRSLLDMLSFEAELGKGPERRTAEALGVAIFLSVIVGFALSIVWWFLFPSHHNLLPILFLAVPAIVISDVSLTAIKYERVIRWDVWAKCIVDPWVFLFLVIAFWSLGWMSTGLIIAYVGAAIGSTICAVFGLSRVMGLRALMSSRPKITAWLPIIRQSAPIGITDIGIMALRRADLIVLSLFVGPHGTGLYYLAPAISYDPA